ncbi:hypothetical protein FOZ61_004898 [Perkinsus olseni]|uniref:Uncharacterized protein n=1 Tax=Perkinsus olseni TaxID=32597 RepID=A0A7J6LK12_PEROL|nr:hypothetical protein FOZ61_004898 [Perkinsus olseni]
MAAMITSGSTSLRLCCFSVVVYIIQVAVAISDNDISVIADSPPGCHGGDDFPPDPGNIFVVPGACAYIADSRNANGDTVRSVGIQITSNIPGVDGETMTIQLSLDGDSTYLEASGSVSRMFSDRGMDLVWKPAPLDRVFRDSGRGFFLVDVPSFISGESANGEKSSTSSYNIYGSGSSSAVDLHGYVNGLEENGEVAFAAGQRIKFSPRDDGWKFSVNFEASYDGELTTWLIADGILHNPHGG